MSVLEVQLPKPLPLSNKRDTNLLWHPKYLPAAQRPAQHLSQLPQQPNHEKIASRLAVHDLTQTADKVHLVSPQPSQI